jgi:hypothetical protein
MSSAEPRLKPDHKILSDAAGVQPTGSESKEVRNTITPSQAESLLAAEKRTLEMMAGATQRSDTDPYDTTSPPIPIGPHWMIMWPFDPKTNGLPTTHKPTGVYIMCAGSPYAHVHIMGRP